MAGGQNLGRTPLLGVRKTARRRPIGAVHRMRGAVLSLAGRYKYLGVAPVCERVTRCDMASGGLGSGRFGGSDNGTEVQRTDWGGTNSRLCAGGYARLAASVLGATQWLRGRFVVANRASPSALLTPLKRQFCAGPPPCSS